MSCSSWTSRRATRETAACLPSSRTCARCTTGAESPRVGRGPAPVHDVELTTLTRHRAQRGTGGTSRRGVGPQPPAAATVCSCRVMTKSGLPFEVVLRGLTPHPLVEGDAPIQAFVLVKVLDADGDIG